MTRQLLKLLQKPRALPELAKELGLEEDTLRLLLARLAAAGYVGLAYEGSEACGVACKGCSLRRLCPAAGKPETAVPSVYRLTEKGKKALSSGA